MVERTKAFRFNAFGALIFLVVLVLTTPAVFIVKFVDQGGIDLLAPMSNTSIIPNWVAIVISALVIFIFWTGSFKYAVAYIRRGYVFKLARDSVFLDGAWVSRSRIIRYKWRWFSNDLVICTENERFVVHPKWSSNGKEELQNFLRNSEK